MRRGLAGLLLLALLLPAGPARLRAAPSALPGTGRPLPVIGSALGETGARTTDQALADLAAAGVSAVRRDFLWAAIERQPGVYDFSVEDGFVSAAAAHGVEVVAILAYGNPLYSRAGRALTGSALAGGLPPLGLGAAHLYPPDPEHLGAYRAFARALAAHFAGRVRRYEVWNEENAGYRFWPPREDPVAYAALLQAGSAGLREGDAAAVVSLGGVSWPEAPPGIPGQGGPRYLGHLYDAAPHIGDAVDAVAWHPYPYPFVAPEVEIPHNGSVRGSARRVRDLLAERNDPGEQLWVTELGWPTHQEYGVSEQRQAAYLVRAFAGLWAEGTDLLVWFTYSDGPNAAHYQEDAFGLRRYDGTPKPSYWALRTFTSLLGDDSLAGDAAAGLGLGPGEHALEFTGPGERVFLLWTSPEGRDTDYGPFPATDRRRVVEIPTDSAAVVVSVTGEERVVHPVGGTATVELSPSPVYVVVPA